MLEKRQIGSELDDFERQSGRSERPSQERSDQALSIYQAASSSKRSHEEEEELLDSASGEGLLEGSPKSGRGGPLSPKAGLVDESVLAYVWSNFELGVLGRILS